MKIAKSATTTTIIFISQVYKRHMKIYMLVVVVAIFRAVCS